MARVCLIQNGQLKKLGDCNQIFYSLGNVQANKFCVNLLDQTFSKLCLKWSFFEKPEISQLPSLLAMHLVL